MARGRGSVPGPPGTPGRAREAKVRGADCHAAPLRPVVGRVPGHGRDRGPSARRRLDHRTAVEPEERLGAEHRCGSLVIVAVSDDHPVRRPLGVPPAHGALHPVPVVAGPGQDLAHEHRPEQVEVPSAPGLPERDLAERPGAGGLGIRRHLCGVDEQLGRGVHAVRRSRPDVDGFPRLPAGPGCIVHR